MTICAEYQLCHNLLRPFLHVQDFYHEILIKKHQVCQASILSPCQLVVVPCALPSARDACPVDPVNLASAWLVVCWASWLTPTVTVSQQRQRTCEARPKTPNFKWMVHTTSLNEFPRKAGTLLSLLWGGNSPGFARVSRPQSWGIRHTRPQTHTQTSFGTHDYTG